MLSIYNLYTLNQLEMFVRAAEAESFSKAAEELFITPNAVMKQINNLEKEIASCLLVRTHSGIKLTKAGEKMHEEAKFILKYCSEAAERVRKAAETEKNIIRVGASILTPPEVFGEMWAEIRKELRETEFRMVQFDAAPDNSGTIIPKLGENIDIIVSAFDEKSMKKGNYNGIELLKVPLYCIVSVRHKLAEKENVNFEELAGETLLLIGEGRSTYIDELRSLVEKDYKEINIEEIPSYGIEAYNRCAGGDEILIGTGNFLKIHPMLMRIPLQCNIKVSFGIIYPKNPSETVKNVVKTIKEIQEKNQY